MFRNLTECNYSYIQLIDFNARFYSPRLGRFIQPDSIVPELTNSQAWNRYTYALNNPVKYVDPTGHRACDNEGENGECITTSTEELKKSTLSMLRQRFHWEVKGDNWSLKELDNIYQTGLDIKAYVDDLTGGRGEEWIREYMGGTNIHQWDYGRGIGIPSNVYLPQSWNGNTKYDKYYLAHEMAHIWDANVGKLGMIGVVNGTADQLNMFVNELANESKGVLGTWANRFWDGSGYNHIPTAYQFEKGVMVDKKKRPYGNNSTADYLAESFALNVYYPGTNYVPPAATIFVNTFITVQVMNLP